MTTTVDIRFLSHGAHAPNDDGHYCFVEAWCYLRDFEWTDHPAQMSPVIASFLRRWNDGLVDGKRDEALVRYLLHEFAPGDSEVEEQRSYLAFDWLIRTHLPAWLRLVPALAGHAARIEALPEVVDLATAEAAAAPAWAAWDALMAAEPIGPTDREAPWDTLGGAARIAAGGLECDDLRIVARNAVAVAAGIAARAPASGDVLAPTAAVLQESAHQLIERMAAVGRIDTALPETREPASVETKA